MHVIMKIRSIVETSTILIVKAKLYPLDLVFLQPSVVILDYFGPTLDETENQYT